MIKGLKTETINVDLLKLLSIRNMVAVGRKKVSPKQYLSKA